MIINHPEINRENGYVRVSSRIEIEHSQNSLPDTLWFHFPEKNMPTQ